MKVLFALLMLSLPSFCAAREPVKYTTADGCVIAAVYQAPSTGAYVFMNAHGLGSNKAEWARFEGMLEKAGYGFLSFDLRGHGDSRICGGKPVDYRKFDASSWRGLSGDFKAGAEFLKTRSIVISSVIFCGASLGANVALQAATEGLLPAGVIMLSPGFDYAGIRADRLLAKTSVPIFMAAAPEDVYAWKSARYLDELARARGLKAYFVSGNGGHGVALFAGPGGWLKEEIFVWTRGLNKHGRN